MYCSPSTVSMEYRMIRKLPGIVISVSVASGRARCQAVFATMAQPARLTPGVCAPKMGNQRSRAANTAMKIIPSQKEGVDSKNMETPSDPRSKALPRRQATSEEHTSELQSRLPLVFPLLLLKKHN